MVEFSTLQLHKDTKDRIASLRLPGETFDDTVRRMLNDVQSIQENEFLRELDRMYADDAAFEPLA